MAIEETKNCVESIIKNIGNYSYKIVVVDNASSNNSGEELKEFYSNYENIYVVLCNENAGFSKGNNIGYNYLLKLYDTEFIVASNNDIIIEDKDFFKKVCELYKERHFAVLSPDVLSSEGRHQSPLKLKPRTLCEAQRDKLYYCSITTQGRFRYYYKNLKSKLSSNNIIYYIYRKMFRRNKPNIKVEFEKPLYMQEHENVVPIGAFLVFSKVYTQTFDYCFKPMTFLYMEEEFLFHECKSKGLKILYSPELQVLHKKSIAIKSSKSAYTSSLFSAKNMVNALNIYIDWLSNNT